VSSQSPVQSELIANHNAENPIFVEGSFTVWLRYKSLTYFILQADCTDRCKEYKNRARDDSGTGSVFATRMQCIRVAVAAQWYV